VGTIAAPFDFSSLRSESLRAGSKSKLVPFPSREWWTGHEVKSPTSRKERGKWGTRTRFEDKDGRDAGFPFWEWGC